jgi:hypothetical protein
MSEIQLTKPAPSPSKKPRQGRSPAFPFIPLAKALERVETFRVAEGGRPKHFAPITAACKAWGVGPKTGQAIQTVAALGHYGLFEFEGSANTRSVRPTDLALKILLDKQIVSQERDDLIRQAALTPAIHKELWEKWGAELPSDATFETYLVRDRGFSEGGARDLIAEYRANIAFAKLDKPVKIAPVNAKVMGNDPPLPDAHIDDQEEDVAGSAEVGDLVQVEISGAFQLPKPARVRTIRDLDGQKWVFIEGSDTGIPMEQVIVQTKATPPPAGAPPPRIPEELGQREEKFALKEGDVIIRFPAGLSADSVEDLDDYIQVFLKKARREAGVPKKDVAK